MSSELILWSDLVEYALGTGWQIDTRYIGSPVITNGNVKINDAAVSKYRVYTCDDNSDVCEFTDLDDVKTFIDLLNKNPDNNYYELRKQDRIRRSL